MASASTLRDNFTDNSISASVWTSITSGSGTVAETGGQARCTLPNSTAGTHLAFYRTLTTYDLTSDSWYINIETMVATGVAATATYEMFLDSINKITWRQLSNTISARYTVAGTETQAFSATWSSTTYKYLRIRADTTTVYWDSSTNGTSWTNRASLAISSLFAITALYIQFGASCGNIASPGSLRLDDVNLVLPALTTNWRWTQARRALINRHKVTTVAIDTAGTGQGYLITADGVDASDNPSGNVRYWSGPAGAGRLLTEQADEASAQAMAVNIPTDGRFDLPAQIDARVFRFGHRSVDGNSYVIREFYPRRLVQADDIETESIKALHIAVQQITADKLDALMVISNTISTAYNGARVTLSGDAFGGFIGYGTADTYSASAGTGTYQILWSKADGKFYAGGGNVILDSGGVAIVLAGSVSQTHEYSLIRSDGTILGYLSGTDAAGTNHSINLTSSPVTGDNSIINISATAPAGKTASVFIGAGNGTDTPSITLDAASGEFITLNGTTFVNDGLNLGAATGAANGQLLAIASDAATNTVTDLAVFGHDSSGTPAAGFGGNVRINLKSSTTSNQPAAVFQATWATATHASRKARLTIHAYDTLAREGVRIEASGSAPMIGFLGASAVVRQSVAAAAPAGGTGATAGAYDTAAHRDALITLVNDIRSAGIALGLWA